jgi:cbb3-type cytochrome oxidase subunit 3
MTATLISLLAVTAGFAALVLWVYWPSRRARLESLGRIPLDVEVPASDGTDAGDEQEASRGRLENAHE